MTVNTHINSVGREEFFIQEERVAKSKKEALFNIQNRIAVLTQIQSLSGLTAWEEKELGNLQLEEIRVIS